MDKVKYQRKTRVSKDPLPKPQAPSTKKTEEVVEEPTNKYEPKERIGANKPIKRPGAKVTRVGLGNLTVVHTDPTPYNPH